MPEIQSLILAGGINNIILYEGYKPGYKALIEFNGRHSILYTLKAITQSKMCKNKVGIVGSQKDLQPYFDNYQNTEVEFIREGETLLASIFNALKHYKQEKFLLVASADIPLVSGEAIDEFLEGCFKVKAERKDNVFISVVPKEKFSGTFQGTNKDMSRFRDAEVCHGNLFLVNPGVLDNQNAVNRVNTIYNARKNSIQAALATGFRVGISYVIGIHLLHIFTLSQMAKIASLRFGIGFIPVLCSHPEICIDADEPGDYELICRALSERLS